MMFDNVKNVLVVCTGNSCRSIMAEAFLKKRFAEEGMDINVFSAGTLGIEGMLPADNTLKILEEEGISPEGYISSALTALLIRKADLILAMDFRHRDSVIEMDNTAENKVFMMAEFAGDPEYTFIPDPIGQPMSFYRIIFGMIKKSTEGLIKCLKK